MWKVNKEHIRRVKAELQGRRASVLARYESEVKSVEDDFNEIEELERLAYAFAAKHMPQREESTEATAQQTPAFETDLGERCSDVAAEEVPVTMGWPKKLKWTLRRSRG